MFQFYHLIAELTVVENILLPCIVGGQKYSAALQKTKDICNRLGLSERLHFYPKHLSGGEQQRVALARAIINEPEVLFCDEPTGNLDHESSENIRTLLRDLNMRNKTTLLLVTHNLELAKDAKRVLNIKDGHIVDTRT